MKRTLTAAAAVLAGGAGAVGFAATANAAETPQLPAELPTDNNLAQTAYHFAGTVHSAQQTVGDVVPVQERLAGRSGADDSLNGLTGALDGDKVTGKLGDMTGGKSLDTRDPLGTLPVGEVIPAGQTLPLARTGGPANDLLPPEMASALDGTRPGVPQTGPEQQNVDLVGEALNGALAGSPAGGSKPSVARGGEALGGVTGPQGPLGGVTNDLPVGKTAPAAPLGQVDDLLGHGPLGGANQLGG